MTRRGPKLKFSKSRDAAALFLALRPTLGYRPAMRAASVLLCVPERNIEREIDPETTFLDLQSPELMGICAIAKNKGLIKANMHAIKGVADWPERLRDAVTNLFRTVWSFQLPLFPTETLGRAVLCAPTPYSAEGSDARNEQIEDNCSSTLRPDVASVSLETGCHIAPIDQAGFADCP